MAVTLNTLTTIDITGSGTGGSTTFTLASGVEYLQVCLACLKSSGTTAFTLDALTITDGTNTLTLTSAIIQRNEVWGATTKNIAIAGGKPSDATPAALTPGTVTISATYNANVNTAGPDGWVFQLDMGTSASSPYRGMAGTGIFSATATDPFTAFADFDVLQDAFVIAFCLRANGGTMTVAGSSTGGSWTQVDDTSFAGSRGSIQYKASTASYTETALALNPSTAQEHLGFLFQLKEANDCDIDSAATAPFEPGATVTFTGTAMNASGAGARIRKVGDAASYDAMGTPSSVTSTTFDSTIPNRPSSVPYTSEDGTTHTLEFIATTSGVVTGTATSAYTFNPPAGFARTTLTTPDLTEASLCYDFGWTAIAGDQIEYDALVTVSGTDVTILVNTDGTVTLDSSPDPLPDGVTFKWRALDSGSKLWTGSASDLSDWATWSDGGGSSPSANPTGKVGRSILDLMRRRRH